MKRLMIALLVLVAISGGILGCRCCEPTVIRKETEHRERVIDERIVDPGDAAEKPK